ncbi:MAG: HEPN domain-containing protein [bacterium]|nr:HEPN domain-containing protein [bacterium]
MHKVTICTVLFGVDESVLNIELGNGFLLKKMSLIPSKDHLNEIFSTDAMALRREYEEARVDNELNVICVYKYYSIDLDMTELEEYHTKVCMETLEYLDNKIRIIRLYSEGAIRFKRLSVIINSDKLYMGETEVKCKQESIIPISEAMGTREISKIYVKDNELEYLNNGLKAMVLPFNDIVINNTHRYYDLSYHVEKNVSLSLLITCLELLFLNSENAKKERASKRCTVFLYKNQEERVICYNKLKVLYKKRCDFVHDGDDSKIQDNDILILRDYIRKCIIKYWENRYAKIDVIKKLQDEIRRLDYWE